MSDPTARADHLRVAGAGCVVGDFNAILPSDSRLAQELGLIDAREEVTDILVEPFPPCRLDRAALFGNLVPVDVQVLLCGKVAIGSESTGEYWSDHCGLFVKLHLANGTSLTPLEVVFPLHRTAQALYARVNHHRMSHLFI